MPMKLYVLFAALGLFASFWKASAATVSTWTWTGGGSSTLWSTIGNWSPSSALSGTVALSFKGSAGTTNSNDIKSLTVSNVAVSSTSAAWNFSGHAITLTGSIAVSGSNAVVWAINTVLAPSSSCIFQTNGGTLTVSGVLSGTGRLQTKGSVILSGSNTYSGGTLLSSGIIRYDNLNAFGSGTLTIASSCTVQAGVSGTLANAVSNIGTSCLVDTLGNTATFSGVISGGAFSKIGSGVLILTNGANSQTETKIMGGMVEYDAIGAIGSKVTFTLGTLRAGVSGTVLSGGINVTSSGNMMIDTQNYQVTVSGMLTGGQASLTKIGTGTLVFSKSSTYAGTLCIAEGTLGFSDAEALGVGDVSFTGNSTLLAGVSGALQLASLNVDAGVTGTFNTAGYAVSTSAAVMGSGTLAVTGNGLLELTNGENTLGGGLVVSGGTLRLGDGTGDVSFTAATLSIVNSGVMEYTTYSTGTIAGNISGTGSLKVSGPGILILSGSNTYSGRTVVSQSGLSVSGYLAASGGIDLLAATLAGNGTIAGTVSGSDGTIGGHLTIGQVSLGGTSCFSGTTSVSGNVSVASGTATVKSGAQVSSSAVLSVSVGASYVNEGNTSAAAVGVDGTMINNGILSGPVSVTGRLSGTGVINGALTIRNEGVLAPESGTATLAGGLVVESGAKVSLQITSTAHDQIVIQGGSVMLQSGSILDLVLDGSLKAGDVLVLISNHGGSAISGTFGGLLISGTAVSLANNTFLYNGAQYLLVYNANGTSNDLELVMVPEPSVGIMLLTAMGLLAGLARLRGAAGAC